MLTTPRSIPQGPSGPAALSYFRALSRCVQSARVRLGHRTPDQIQAMYEWMSMSELEIFSSLHEIVLRRLARTMEFVTVPTRTTLFEAGDELDKIYIVTKGEVTVWVPDEPVEDNDEIGKEDISITPFIHYTPKLVNPSSPLLRTPTMEQSRAPLRVPPLRLDLTEDSALQGTSGATHVEPSTPQFLSEFNRTQITSDDITNQRDQGRSNAPPSMREQDGASEVKGFVCVSSMTVGFPEVNARRSVATPINSSNISNKQPKFARDDNKNRSSVMRRSILSTPSSLRASPGVVSLASSGAIVPAVTSRSSVILHEYPQIPETGPLTVIVSSDTNLHPSSSTSSSSSPPSSSYSVSSASSSSFSSSSSSASSLLSSSPLMSFSPMNVKFESRRMRTSSVFSFQNESAEKTSWTISPTHLNTPIQQTPTNGFSTPSSIAASKTASVCVLGEEAMLSIIESVKQPDYSSQLDALPKLYTQHKTTVRVGSGTPLEALVIKVSKLRELLLSDPEKELKAIIIALRTVFPSLTEAPQSVLRLLAVSAERGGAARGETIFRHGDSADRVLFLLEGTCRVEVDVDVPESLDHELASRGDSLLKQTQGDKGKAASNTHSQAWSFRRRSSAFQPPHRSRNNSKSGTNSFVRNHRRSTSFVPSSLTNIAKSLISPNVDESRSQRSIQDYHEQQHRKQLDFMTSNSSFVRKRVSSNSDHSIPKSSNSPLPAHFHNGISSFSNLKKDELPEIQLLKATDVPVIPPRIVTKLTRQHALGGFIVASGLSTRNASLAQILTGKGFVRRRSNAKRSSRQKRKRLDSLDKGKADLVGKNEIGEDTISNPSLSADSTEGEPKASSKKSKVVKSRRNSRIPLSPRLSILLQAMKLPGSITKSIDDKTDSSIGLEEDKNVILAGDQNGLQIGLGGHPPNLSAGSIQQFGIIHNTMSPRNDEYSVSKFNNRKLQPSIHNWQHNNDTKESAIEILTEPRPLKRIPVAIAMVTGGELLGDVEALSIPRKAISFAAKAAIESDPKYKIETEKAVSTDTPHGQNGPPQSNNAPSPATLLAGVVERNGVPPVVATLALSEFFYVNAEERTNQNHSSQPNFASRISTNVLRTEEGEGERDASPAILSLIIAEAQPQHLLQVQQQLTRKPQFGASSSDSPDVLSLEHQSSLSARFYSHSAVAVESCVYLSVPRLAFIRILSSTQSILIAMHRRAVFKHNWRLKQRLCLRNSIKKSVTTSYMGLAAGMGLRSSPNYVLQSESQEAAVAVGQIGWEAVARGGAGRRGIIATKFSRAHPFAISRGMLPPALDALQAQERTRQEIEKQYLKEFIARKRDLKPKSNGSPSLEAGLNTIKDIPAPAKVKAMNDDFEHDSLVNSKNLPSYLLSARLASNPREAIVSRSLQHVAASTLAGESWSFIPTNKGNKSKEDSMGEQIHEAYSLIPETSSTIPSSRKPSPSNTVDEFDSKTIFFDPLLEGAESSLEKDQSFVKESLHAKRQNRGQLHSSQRGLIEQGRSGDKTVVEDDETKSIPESSDFTHLTSSYSLLATKRQGSSAHTCSMASSSQGVCGAALAKVRVNRAGESVDQQPSQPSGKRRVSTLSIADIVSTEFKAGLSGSRNVAHWDNPESLHGEIMMKGTSISKDNETANSRDGKITFKPNSPLVPPLPSIRKLISPRDFYPSSGEHSELSQSAAFSASKSIGKQQEFERKPTQKKRTISKTCLTGRDYLEAVGIDVEAGIAAIGHENTMKSRTDAARAAAALQAPVLTGTGLLNAAAASWMIDESSVDSRMGSLLGLKSLQESKSGEPNSNNASPKREIQRPSPSAVPQKMSVKLDALEELDDFNDENAHLLSLPSKSIYEKRSSYGKDEEFVLGFENDIDPNGDLGWSELKGVEALYASASRTYHATLLDHSIRERKGHPISRKALATMKSVQRTQRRRLERIERRSRKLRERFTRIIASKMKEKQLALSTSVGESSKGDDTGIGNDQSRSTSGESNDNLIKLLRSVGIFKSSRVHSKSQFCTPVLSSSGKRATGLLGSLRGNNRNSANVINAHVHKKEDLSSRDSLYNDIAPESLATSEDQALGSRLGKLAASGLNKSLLWLPQLQAWGRPPADVVVATASLPELMHNGDMRSKEYQKNGSMLREQKEGRTDEGSREFEKAFSLVSPAAQIAASQRVNIPQAAIGVALRNQIGMGQVPSNGAGMGPFKQDQSHLANFADALNTISSSIDDATTRVPFDVEKRSLAQDNTSESKKEEKGQAFHPDHSQHAEYASDLFKNNFVTTVNDREESPRKPLIAALQDVQSQLSRFATDYVQESELASLSRRSMRLLGASTEELAIRAALLDSAKTTNDTFNSSQIMSPLDELRKMRSQQYDLTISEKEKHETEFMANKKGIEAISQAGGDIIRRLPLVRELLARECSGLMGGGQNNPISLRTSPALSYALASAAIHDRLLHWNAMTFDSNPRKTVNDSNVDKIQSISNGDQFDRNSIPTYRLRSGLLSSDNQQSYTGGKSIVKQYGRDSSHSEDHPFQSISMSKNKQNLNADNSSLLVEKRPLDSQNNGFRPYFYAPNTIVAQSSPQIHRLNERPQKLISQTSISSKSLSKETGTFPSKQNSLKRTSEQSISPGVSAGIAICKFWDRNNYHHNLRHRNVLPPASSTSHNSSSPVYDLEGTSASTPSQSLFLPSTSHDATSSTANEQSLISLSDFKQDLNQELRDNRKNDIMDRIQRRLELDNRTEAQRSQVGTVMANATPWIHDRQDVRRAHKASSDHVQAVIHTAKRQVNALSVDR